MSTRIAKDIFLDAIELPEGEQDAFVRSACGADEALLARVNALLATYRRSEGFLDRPAAVPVSDDGSKRSETSGPKPGDRIDRFELIRPIGEGGFGTVWLARQVSPVVRQVALKLIRRGMDSAHIVARFEAERQTLAMMEHPNIAKVFDAGTTETGQPYFVMEYVDGLPITEFCDRRKLDVRARLELLQQVCYAVQHAHQKGIIHRDLKPNNILVSESAGRAESKVIDFGVSKATDTSGASHGVSPGLTGEFQIIGTPQYMSPEQATSGAKVIDTRSDVYSLGTVMYELIAGSPPFDPAVLRSAGMERVWQIIREETPAKPSTRVSETFEKDATLAAARRSDSSRLKRQVVGEIDWIVMKALEKEPQRRYQSAAELAADIGRHLSNQAVSAGPPSKVYQFRKFARRHRLQIAAASVVLIALAMTAVVSSVMYVRASRARVVAELKENEAQAAREQADASARQAKEELTRSNTIAGFLTAIFEGLSPGVARGRDTSLLKDVLADAEKNLTARVGDEPVVEMALRDMIGGAMYSLGDSEKAVAFILPAFEATRSKARPDNLERLRAGGTVTSILINLGRYEEAERVNDEIVGLYEKLGQSNSRPALATRIARGSLAMRRNDFERAREVYGALVNDARRLKLDEDQLTLEATNGLALATKYSGRDDEACKIWRELIPVLKRALGPEDPQTLFTLNNLATTLQDLKRYDEAEACFREVMAAERKIYERGHPNLVRSMNNFGAFLLAAGKTEEGEALLEEAWGMATIKLEPSNKIFISLSMKIIALRRKQQRWDDAIAIARGLHETDLKTFGPNDWKSWVSATTMMTVYWNAKRYEEGIAVFEPISSPPADMPADRLQSFCAGAGLLYLGAGKRDQAIEQHRLARETVGDPAKGKAAAGDKLKVLEESLNAPATQPTATTQASTSPTTQSTPK